MASMVSMAQSYMDEQDKQKMEADLARMLVMLDQIAGKNGGGSGRTAGPHQIGAKRAESFEPKHHQESCTTHLR